MSYKTLQIQKSKDRFASRQYRIFLTEQNCIWCGGTPCDPDHTVSRKWATGSDALCVPICRRCHGLKTANKLKCDDYTGTIELLWIRFLKEREIPYSYPLTQQDFENLLRERGLIERSFTRRKNRKPYDS